MCVALHLQPGPKKSSDLTDLYFFVLFFNDFVKFVLIYAITWLQIPGATAFSLIYITMRYFDYKILPLTKCYKELTLC